MKTVITTLMAFAVAGWFAAAQDAEFKGTPLPATAVPEPVRVPEVTYTLPPPNELKSGTVMYSGVVPHGIKLRSAFQLINPLAPKSAGSGEFNVVKPMPGDNAPGIALVRISY